jgi:hypothetical protein
VSSQSTGTCYAVGTSGTIVAPINGGGTGETPPTDTSTNTPTDIPTNPPTDTPTVTPTHGRCVHPTPTPTPPPFDEYRARVYPVLVGGGIPFFPQRERRVDLELIETRSVSSRVVYLRYRVAR